MVTAVPPPAGPTDGDQPVPPPPVFDEAVPHRRAEAWVRGGWVEFAGARFALGRADVWHQVEVIEIAGRFSLRIGGVLRASRPVFWPAHPLRRFGSDGEVVHVTVTSSGMQGLRKGEQVVQCENCGRILVMA